MEKIQYNKLVRDKIPNIIKKSGGKCKVKRLTSDGLIAELCKKPKEEYEEYCKAKTSDERLGELADIIYPVLCLQRHLSLSSLALKTHRANFRGLYDEEIFDLKEELGKHISSLHGSNADLEITTVMTSGILEIAILLAAKDGFTVEELSSQIKEKQTQKGGFKYGYYLVWATKK